MAGCTTRSTRHRRRKRSRRDHGGSRTGPTLPARLAPTARSAPRSRKAVDRRQPATTSPGRRGDRRDRKSTRLNSSHVRSSYAVFCLKKKKKKITLLSIKKKKKKKNP